MKLLNKFGYILLSVGMMASVAACSDDDKDSAPDIKLTASLTSFPEGVESFDESTHVLVVGNEGTINSAIKFGGGDLSKVSLNAVVADKTWCIAKCTPTRLALTVVKNNAELARENTIDISVSYAGQVIDTYQMKVLQQGVTKVEEPVEDKSKLAELKQFIISGQVSSKINSTIVQVTMPYGADLTSLTPIYEISEGATCFPGNMVDQDFSKPVIYSVTSADRSVVKQYIVSVSCQQPSSSGGDISDPTQDHNPNFQMFDEVYVGAGSMIFGQDNYGYTESGGQLSPAQNAHKCNLSAFYMGKYEVTQREFVDVMGYNPSVFQYDDQLPVHKVTLFEAMLYCNKLSERNGLTTVYTFSNEVWGTVGDHKELYQADVVANRNANGYRLPTRAEFEYAAKGGPNQDPYSYSGSNDHSEVAWNDETSLIKGVPTMRCVGLLMPNSLGLYDVTGNVEEYTGEWYESIYFNSDAEETDPWGPAAPLKTGEDKYMVYCHGGNYDSYPSSGRNTNHRLLNGNIKNDSSFPGGEIWFEKIGFRPVRYDK